MPWTDCGLMAALSTEVYRWRGARALPVQLVLHFNRWSTRGWANLWRKAGLEAHWCQGDVAYHEVTGVIDATGALSLWDALGRFWIPIPNSTTYEGIVAIRLCEQAGVRQIARVKGQLLRPGSWYILSDISDVHERMVERGRELRSRRAG